MHQFYVDPVLEDLAGNRMDVVFDRDRNDGGQSMVASEDRIIAFVQNE